METPVQFCYLKKIENLVSVPNPVLKIRPRSSLVFAKLESKPVVLTCQTGHGLNTGFNLSSRSRRGFDLSNK
jgi:hypothetical protein